VLAESASASPVTVSAPPGAAAAAGPVAERRVCSVLFCDVVGFTPLSESRDPEAVRELLSEYFAVARTVVGRYGGVVEKFIGDAVMAVWGTPVAVEGDAERAVRAALDLVAAVADLGADAGVPGLAARAGVVTGEVAVTLGAVGEGMVAGDAVNTAARVQAAAGAGLVLVDAWTRRLAEAAVGFTGAGEHELKGKAGLVQLWRATRVLAGIGGAKRIDGLEAPLTGRDAELRTVKELFQATTERRVPRLLLISGPAGVGKTRLGWEFEKYTDGLAETVWWHRGRCPAYGEGVAFWALAEIIRQRLSIAEDDPADTAAAKLATGLAEFITDRAERGYIGARLSRLLGVRWEQDDEAALSREELFAGWRLFFERIAALHPVVLLIEDAEAADAGLLDFLEHLIDWVRDLPVFVLVFARPELARARPGLGTGRHRSTLTLDPLNPVSMEALVDALVPGMPAAARSQVTDHAQGMPLFAVETIRSLIDRDIVQPIEGAYRLVGQFGELDVPEGLHALLAARLDALDPGARRLVTDAAVLGTTFAAEALPAVSGQDQAAVDAGLGELVRREVLSVSADPLSPERGSYSFTHQMLRQVAYRTMSRRERKARHLKVAAYLRASFPGDGEEVADVIARHYLDALEAIPSDPDIEELRGLAIGALSRAAERAERTGAPALAATSYATAAQLTQVGTRDGQAAAATLWEHAAQAVLANAGWATAIEQAGHARELYLQCGDTRSAARAQAIAGQALWRWGRLGEARDQLTAALTVLREDPGTDTAQALGELARLEQLAGSAEADTLSGEALALGQALSVDDATLADLFTYRGISHAYAGRRPQAAAYYREAARLATQAGDTARLGRALLNLADTVTATDPAAGAEAARAAAAHLRQAGARDVLAVAVANVATALLMTGDWDTAEAELTQATDGDGLADVEFLACYRAWLAALRGDVPTAQAALAGLSDLRATEDLQDRANVEVAEAFTAAACRQPSAALRLARLVLGYADTLGISHEYPRWAWPLAARAAHDLADTATTHELLAILDGYQPGELAPMQHAERDLARARLAALDGDPGADPALTAAITGLRQHSTPYHLAHGLLDHAQHRSHLGDVEAARAAIAEAAKIAQCLRCQPLLDRAETIQPASPAPAAS
jgi:class 3 adenylate cyclase